MIEDSWVFAFAFIGAIGSAATAAALFFLWRQSNHTEKQILLTQEEIEKRLRPWLGISDIRRNDNRSIQVVLGNTGSLPAKIVRTQQFRSSSLITEEQLRSGTDIPTKVVIFPNGKKDIGFSDSVVNVVQYFGILVQYEYAKDKRGEIGAILKYDEEFDSFAILDEFAN